MSTAEIKARMGPEFRPFVLSLSDGRKFSVPTPDHIAIGRAFVVVIGDDDISRTIDALHIVSIDETFLER